MPALACATLLAAVAAQQQAEPRDNGEVVVTGERVPRPVRETASSVLVVTAHDIEASGADRVDQLLHLVPNVQLGNGSQGPSIRGMDTTGPLQALPAFLGGNRTRTTLIVDGRPVTYNEFVFGTFPVWDLNRIEVFRSPQTTTQGQNSIAGAIFVNSNDPSFEPEAAARAIVGDYRTRQVSALASGPLAGDRLALRVAGDMRYSRTTSDIADVMRGADPNHDLFGLVRAKLLFAPDRRTRALLTFAHSQSQAPQGVGISAPFRERRDDDPNYGVFRINVDSLTASVRREVGNGTTVNLMLTGGDMRARRLAIPHFGETTNHSRDWSGEAIVNWRSQGPVSAVAGISHTHVSLKQFIDLSLLSGAIGRFRDWQDGSGVFGDLGIALSSRAKLTAGLRYQRDRQKRRGALTATSFTVPVDFVGAFEAWLPKLTFAYDVTPRLRVGAMVQKAYNPGGTTIRVDTSSPDSFKAETLWDYEIFARAELAGGRASLSGNLFYYDMRNAQRAESIIVVTPSGRRAGFANQFNVPKARTLGAEGQARWRVDDALSARVAIGLLSTRVIDTDEESAALQGKQFDRAPHFSGTLAIDWRATERLQLSGQLRHHSAYFTDAENLFENRIGGGTNVDARAEYRLGKAAIFAQVRNLFDSFNLLDRFSDEAAEAEPPRTFAVGVETAF